MQPDAQPQQVAFQLGVRAPAVVPSNDAQAPAAQSQSASDAAQPPNPLANLLGSLFGGAPPQAAARPQDNASQPQPMQTDPPAANSNAQASAAAQPQVNLGQMFGSMMQSLGGA